MPSSADGEFISRPASLELDQSHPRSNDQFSVFGETSCGEPFLPQHLRLDFTPNDEDSDFVQRKICSFWKFINNSHDIRNLKVYPDRARPYFDMTSEGEAWGSIKPLSLSTESERSSRSEAIHDLEETAVSRLEFVEEKGLINRIFDAKTEQSVCTLGSREYKENAPDTPHIMKEDCKCTSICEVCPGVDPPVIQQDSSVTKLCKQMKEWDAKHHKSMSPPRHAPALIHSALQRKVYPLQ